MLHNPICRLLVTQSHGIFTFICAKVASANCSNNSSSTTERLNEISKIDFHKHSTVS